MRKNKHVNILLMLTAGLIGGSLLTGSDNVSAAKKSSILSSKSTFTPFGKNKPTVEQPTYNLNISDKAWRRDIKKGMNDWNKNFKKYKLPYRFKYTYKKDAKGQFTMALIKAPKLKYKRVGKKMVPIVKSKKVSFMTWYDGVISEETSMKYLNTWNGVASSDAFPKSDLPWRIFGAHIFLNTTNLTHKNKLDNFNGNPQLTIEHELGHTLGLDHNDVTPSIINWQGSTFSKNRDGTVTSDYVAQKKSKGKYYNIDTGRRVYADYISKYDMRAVGLRYKSKFGQSSVDLKDKIHPDPHDKDDYERTAAPRVGNKTVNYLIPEYAHPMSDVQLKKTAQYIVSGKVIKSTTTKQNKLSVTDQVIAVNKAFKGKLHQSTITVRQLGDSNSVSAETKVLHAKQSVVLYLVKSDHGRYILINDGASIFIKNSKKGHAFYTRGNDSSQYQLKSIVR